MSAGEEYTWLPDERLTAAVVSVVESVTYATASSGESAIEAGVVPAGRAVSVSFDSEPELERGNWKM